MSRSSSGPTMTAPMTWPVLGVTRMVITPESRPPRFLSALLNIQRSYRQGVPFDKIPAAFDFFAHELVEDVVGLACVLDPDLEEAAFFRVHGGFPELFRVHFAKALVPLDVDAF